ncbi:NTP transferase domain-containing protein [Nocardia sp. NBC_01327]|uniref:NTP transferase domain-containing protein n=1 Tax=Nocardia sp. NBC_01327 TaxID=2903593 RepID=UPI002E11D439|nr:NTP transferase domain-containing protein [Nocardia sp. NBC_01327]
MTTIVVLAAGTGGRFGSTYPKELHTIAPHTAVIDPLMEAIDALPLPDIKLIVVISPAKLALVAHLERYHRNTSFVLQRPVVPDGMAAALLSAVPWCDDTTLVCLGDMVYLTDPVLALTEALDLTQAGAPVTVVAAATEDPNRLRVEGALAVTDGIVTAAREKPTNPTGFNATWSALAINKSMLKPVGYGLAEHVTDCFVDAPVVWGPDFVNFNVPPTLLPVTSVAEGALR